MKRKIEIFCIIIFSVSFVCCSHQKSERYLKDKEHIELAFIDNVEMSRRAMSFIDGHLYGTSYDGIPDSLRKYTGSIFREYAVYQNSQTGKIFAVPKPTNEWLDVQVGRISYSSDSLKCVALVVIKDKSSSFTDQKSYKPYSGRAIIGIRDNIDENFKIYPENFVSLDLYPNRFSVLSDLKSYYHNLKGEYKCGINNPEFFESSPEFIWIDSLNLYRCQTDMRYGKIIPYIFYSNQEATINKHLFDE